MSDDDRNLFDDDDLFGDFEDDTSGDDFGDFGGFDDLDDDELFPEDDLGSLDETPDDLGDLDDAEEEQSRSPLLIILGVVLIVLILGGVALLAFALVNRGPSPTDITRTAIAQANATTEALLDATNTSSAATQSFFATATASSPTPSPTNTPTPTETPDFDATSTSAAAENQSVIQATQVALDATATSIQITVDAVSAAATQGTVTGAQVVGDDPTPTQEGGGVITVSDVQMTATALAELFTEPEPTDPGTGGVVDGGGFIATPISPTGPTGPTTLPDTGLFDDLAASGGGPGVLFLMVFGLVGVIFVSRRLRQSNRK